MKTFTLKKMSIPKIAVLATGLAAALMVATINPAPAMATPTASRLTCTGCHDAAGGSVTATPSTTAPAAGAAFTVTIAITGPAGDSGYNISLAGVSVLIGQPSAASTTTANLTAPTAAGTYIYQVGANKGGAGDAAAGAGSLTTFTITVGGSTTTTTPPVETTTTTTPPVETTTTTPPVTTAPGAPTEVTAVAGDGGAIVFWEPPVNATDDTVYTVTASPGGATVTTSSDAALFTGLTNGTEYTFTVVATNEFGTSPVSDVSNTVIPAVVVVPTTTTPAATTTTTPAVADDTDVAPVGGIDTGAGGASNLR